MLHEFDGLTSVVVARREAHRIHWIHGIHPIHVRFFVNAGVLRFGRVRMGVGG